MDNYTFDENGIPTLVDDLTDSCPNTPQNYGDSRQYSQRKASTTTEPDRQIQSFTSREDITDIFDIKGEGFDFKLSYSTQTLTWAPMNPGRSRSRSAKKSFKSLFRSNSSSSIAVNKNSLNFRDILGVKIRRRKRGGQKDGEGFCLGFGILTYEFKTPNVMKDRMIHLEHPSEEVCEKWVTKISEILETFDERPRSVKLFLQPFAGEKDGLSMFRQKILPLFRTADCNVDMTEIQHNEQVKQDLIHINLLDFDCLVCMGGDGTVNKVVNGLLNQSNKDYGIEMKRTVNPVPATIALGIIPTGKTNHIAQSIMGTDEPVTAVLHVLFGNRTKVDVCSIYHEEKFQRWAFNSQYGFAGNVLTFMKRYSALGMKCVEAAFLKALTKSKLRTYECDIEYIPGGETVAPVFCTRCVTYCKVCSAESNNVHNDLVEELDPMAQSGSTSSLIDLGNTSNPWKTLKGDFLNVGLFTISGVCDFAPQGLSKYTHLNDGCMDLAVVKNVDRKDFIRFLRRHGNSKNQFDFPFVETFRVKEVRFRPRFPSSWNYKDHDFNEIDYEMSKVNRNQINNRSKSMQVITDLDSEDRSSVTSMSWGGNGRRAESAMTLQALSIDSDMEESDPHESDGRSNYNMQSQSNLTGPQYRMTFYDKERQKRNKHQRKKDEKRKDREERKMRSVWSVDNEICSDLELDFKVHHGLLIVCGSGLNPSTPAQDVKFGCLPGL
ncbi:hypothetical protein SNE40_012934 [Patella caerulea]|uniref:DAGKc domain-containing protein n=1 Tax=Patella caerulea TaxID=87958 RepID=A0AAN8JJW0_PATCE